MNILPFYIFVWRLYLSFCHIILQRIPRNLFNLPKKKAINTKKFQLPAEVGLIQIQAQKKVRISDSEGKQFKRCSIKYFVEFIKRIPAKRVFFC